MNRIKRRALSTVFLEIKKNIRYIQDYLPRSEMDRWELVMECQLVQTSLDQLYEKINNMPKIKKGPELGP